MKPVRPFKIFRLGFALFFLLNQAFFQPSIGCAQPETITSNKALSFQKLVLPENLGVIEESYRGRNNAEVVILKDAHTVADAQHSISEIIQYLEINHGLDWVGAEGAAGSFQTELFESFPNQDVLKKTLETLVAHGELAGAALSALTHHGNVSYEGLEDGNLYQRQLETYYSSALERTKLEKQLKAFELQLKVAKVRYYSSAARAWDLSLSKLEDEKTNPLALLQALKEMAQNILSFSKKYPHLSAVLVESNLNERNISDANVILRKWKSALEQKNPSVLHDKDWNLQSQAWKTGALSDFKYAAYLEDYSNRKLGLTVPAPLKGIASVGKLITKMRAQIWAQEWKNAVQETSHLVFKAPDEKNTAESSLRLQRLKNAVRLQLTSEDWTEMKKPRSVPKLKSTPATNFLAQRLESLRRALEEAECAQFYEVASARESVFIQKIEKAFKAGKKRTAIVVGGFHADDLAEELRKKKISFVVISPAIQNLGETDTYAKLMRGDVSWKNSFKIKDGRIQVYESFASAMIYQLLNLEKNKSAPKQLLPYFKEWRENLIRRTFNPTRMNEAFEALNLLDEEVLNAFYGQEFQDLRKTMGAPLMKQSTDLQNPQTAFKMAAGMMTQAWPTVPFGTLKVDAKSSNQGLMPSAVALEVRSEMRVLPREQKVSDEALAKLWQAAAQADGSFTRTISTMQELKDLSDSVGEYQYVVSMDKEKAVQKFKGLEAPLKVRIYPRQVEARNFKEATMLLLERQIRAGRAIELPSGEIEWQPFMKIIETGEVVTYVVYKDGKVVKNKGKPFFVGSIPEKVKRSADYIFILNAARAKRPGSHSGAPALPVEHPSDDPATEIPNGKIIISPENIKENILDEMYFWIEGPEGQRWMVVENQFSALPPTMEQDHENQPQMLVMTREAEDGRRSYAQNWMHRSSNLQDVFTAHAEFEGVSEEWRKNYPELSEAAAFAMGAIFNKAKPDAYNMIVTGKNTDHVFAVNGYHPPNTPSNVHGGASQLHGHAQHVNFNIPLKNVPAEYLTPQGEIAVGNKKAILSTLNWGGEKALVIDYGDQRIFIFSRPNGKAEGFDNIWSFLELARAIIVDVPERVFSDPATRAEVNPQLLSDAEKAFSSTDTPLTANDSEMVKLAQDLKDIKQLKNFLRQAPYTQRDDELFSKLTFTTTEAAKFFSPSIPKFIWRLQSGGEVLLMSEKFPGGILELVMQFRELAVWGRESERGQVAMRSLRFHAQNGDIFRYLRDLTKTSGAGMKPFSDKMNQLAQQAEKHLVAAQKGNRLEREAHFESALALNYQALELIDQLGDWIAENAINFYLDEPAGSGLDFFEKNVVSNRTLRKYMSHALSRKENAFLTADVEGIHSYQLEREMDGMTQQLILTLNVGVIPTPVPQGPEMKARGKILPEGNFKLLLSSLGIDGNTGYNVIDAKKGNAKKKVGPLSFNQALPVEISEPEGIQLLQIKPSGFGLAHLIDAPSRGLNLRSQQAAIEEALEHPEVIREMFEEIVSVSPADAQNRFGKKTPVIMALVAGIQPELIDRVRDWNPFAYASLKKVISQNPELFSSSSVVTFHNPDRAGTMVFSRTLPGNNENLANGDNGENVIFALQFEDDTVNPNDGKVWSIVRDLGSEEKPIALSRTRRYQVKSLLDPNQTIYEAVRSGAEFLRHWDVGIPVVSRGVGHRKDQHDWGFDLYQIVPTTARTKRETPEWLSQPLPKIPELMLAVNLMDIGAEIVAPDGKVIYFDSFNKLQDTLGFFRAMGYGKIYFYGGLFEMGDISVKLHGISGTEQSYIVDDDSFPRTIIRGGYKVKDDPVLADNHGNSFSPISMRTLNPKLSDHRATDGFSTGTVEQTREQFRALNEFAHSLGMKVVSDFIPWVAPEGVTEENYKMFFYKEISDDFTQKTMGRSFSNLSEDEKQTAMKGLLKQGGFFVKRFGEPGSDRLVLIRHMYNEPGIDQAMLNPFHPLAQEYYLEALKQRVNEGSDEVRVDLAHKLLRQALEPIFRDWVDQGGWQVDGENGKFRANEEPFGIVIERAKAYAREKGKTLEFDMEAYDFGPDHVAVHRRLQAIGADRAYFVPVHQTYHKVAQGNGDANDLRALLQMVLDLKAGKLNRQSVLPLLEMIFLSNYDEPSVNQMGGPKRAMWMALLAMAKAGAPVMQDLRDGLDHYGQFITIPGANHPVAKASERERRGTFSDLLNELERAPAVAIAREFAALEPAEGEIQVSFLDNEKTYQFAAMHWVEPEVREARHKLLVLNIKPHEDHSIWIQAPAGTDGMQAEDTLTGEKFEIKNGQIQNLAMPTTLPYRALRIVSANRSELRIGALEDFVAIGRAAGQLHVAHPDDIVPAWIVSSATEGMTIKPAGRSEARVLDQLDEFANKHFLAYPDMPFNVGFAISFSDEIKADFLAYAQKIKRLQEKFGSRVVSHLTLWVDEGNQNNEFQTQVSQLGVKVVLLSKDAPVRIQQITMHLRAHEEVFAFGLENMDVSPSLLPQELRHLIVSAPYSLSAVFAPAVVLNVATAAEGKITASMVESIPARLAFVGFSNGTLMLLETILDRVALDVQMKQLISSMA